MYLSLNYLKLRISYTITLHFVFFFFMKMHLIQKSHQEHVYVLPTCYFQLLSVFCWLFYTQCFDVFATVKCSLVVPVSRIQPLFHRERARRAGIVCNLQCLSLILAIVHSTGTGVTFTELFMSYFSRFFSQRRLL